MGLKKIEVKKKQAILYCDQSNYSSRIVFAHIPIEFGQTENIVYEGWHTAGQVMLQHKHKRRSAAFMG